MFNTFKEIDFTLPRSSNQQAKIGTKIQKSQAQKGDLIFFATNGSRSINHVGMITEIIGDEIKFIHSSTSLGVIVSSIKEAYYSKRFKQINRVLGLKTEKD
jgi:cell wall-associated NlpC family hydrolase